MIAHGDDSLCDLGKEFNPRAYQDRSVVFYNHRADSAVQQIVGAFRQPNSLRWAIASIFQHRQDSVPCRNWSWRNQLLVALHGHTDARGYCQWKNVGRTVRHGEKAFYILSPLKTLTLDQNIGVEKAVVYGYEGTAVFGFDQTEGEPLPNDGEANPCWIKSLPLHAVVRAWGLRAETFGSEGILPHSSWTDELVRVADRRNEELEELGPCWEGNSVAQLGGAALLHMLGMQHDADLRECWNQIQHHAQHVGKQVIEVCDVVLDRACEALSTVFSAATEIQQATCTVEAAV